MRKVQKHLAGFTLLEVVIVMVLTGILGALIASFAAPLIGYFDATARADLSDVADTALRRMARELHSALPNSVRVSGGYIEFLPTTIGGRYRKEQDCSAACTGNILNFTADDTGFDVIGTLDQEPAAGQEIVVYNTGPAAVYAGNNVATLTATADSCTLSTTQICFSGGRRFPLESPSSRFQVIAGPVTFACVETTSTLWRISGYARQAGQPTDITSAPLSTATSIARLATGVDCGNSRFTYASGATQRADLVTMSLTLFSNDNVNVTLLHQAHVQNVP